MDKIAITIPSPNGGSLIIGGSSGMPTGGIDTLSEIIKTGIELLLIASVVLCLAFVIWGGIDWIMAGGNKESIKKARQKIAWAFVGLFVVFLSFLVINTITKVFGINFYDVPRNRPSVPNQSILEGGQ